MRRRLCATVTCEAPHPATHTVSISDQVDVAATTRAGMGDFIDLTHILGKNKNPKIYIQPIPLMTGVEIDDIGVASAPLSLERIRVANPFFPELACPIVVVQGPLAHSDSYYLYDAVEGSDGIDFRYAVKPAAFEQLLRTGVFSRDDGGPRVEEGTIYLDTGPDAWGTVTTNTKEMRRFATPKLLLRV